MTNCPPIYQNIQCESFADGKKITSQLLRQFCKNDAYLYEQVQKLWDMTDPESRKRFYPPYYMDNGKSFGVEPIPRRDVLLKGESIGASIEGLTDFYHLSETTQELYRFNFDKTDDKTYFNTHNGVKTLFIDDENLILDDSTLQLVTSYDTSNDTVDYKLLPISKTATIDSNIPYIVDTKKAKKTKENTYAKKSELDAKCDGAYHDWKANSVWYIGYNRHKNYNIKNSWRKNPDDTSIPSVCRCQTFKAKHTGQLTKVTFLMKGSKDSASPLIVEIRSTDKKGKPTQKVLARTEQKFNHSSKTMVNFIFNKPCEVTKDKKYAIVLRSPLSQFNHCYWIGGWASSCFSNSRKRAYYDGETYLSEDNGKTWIVHGKREKCYGSHYYDWGFAEPPVNFGFEVYVAPKTGTKTVTTYTGSTSEEVYSKSFEFEYYPKGTYYLNFKAFTGGRYTQLVCSHQLTQPTGSIGTWKWQIYDETKTGTVEEKWTDLSSYDAYEVGSNILFFDDVKNFVKLRLVLTLPNNIPVDSEFKRDTTTKNFQAILDEIGSLKLSDNTKLTNWKNSVLNNYAFGKTITKPKNISILLSKSPSPYGYLRTLTYHPEQDTMLPACIWSEVNTKQYLKGDVNLEIDIVHESEKIERVIFSKTNNSLLLAPLLYEFDLVYEKSNYSNLQLASPTSDTAIKNNDTKMQNFMVGNDNKLTAKGQEFADYLKTLSTPVYLLPNGNEKYFDGVNKDCIVLNDYPAYPINSCVSSSESDITLDWSDLKVSSSKVTYTLPRSMSIDQLTLRYASKIGEEEYEYRETTLINNSDNSKAFDYSISGNVITFDLSDYKDSSDNNIGTSILKEFIASVNTSSLTLKTDGDILVSDSHIIIETNDKNLNEFEHYLIDYENKLMKIINPSELYEGDMRINYNPLWCRNLQVDDFPLKMDLWSEYYETRIGTDGEYYFDKFYYKDGEKVTLTNNEPRTMITSVAPRDNIRRVIKNENTNDVKDDYLEDTDYTVDYLNNKIIWDKNRDTYSLTDTFNEGDIWTVKYTPNLTDNGLALIYKMYRSEFVNGIKNVNALEKDTFKLLYQQNYYVKEKEDDIILGSNYWTYRT